MMNPETSILRDIHDLDSVSWWPPATGWWVLFGLVVLLLLAAALRYWLSYSGLMPGWRNDARRQLRALHQALRKQEPREVVGHLSILLRRIAIARGGRQHVAGLSGEQWLQWLESHDTTGFLWTQRARLLLQAPYMPPTWPVERKEVARLLAASRRWVNTVIPNDRARNRARRKPATTVTAARQDG